MQKEQIKSEFIAALREFTKGLTEYTQTENGQWAIKGFIDAFKNVYTVSADTKIISKIIEIHLFPKILEFAQQHAYRIVLPRHQNWYPDLSFVHAADPRIKFAVDIKTTYRDPEYPEHCNGFTLGSHGEYFVNRDSAKNIQFPYKEYLAHVCLGVIYSRVNHTEAETTRVYRVNELEESTQSTAIRKHGATEVKTLKAIPSVIENFLFFVREKWEIASDTSGSGNTANIGSITCIDDIINGRGVFKNLGEQWFDEYWMNYRKIRIPTKDGKTKLLSKLTEYLEYRGVDPALAYPKTRRQKRKSR